MCLVLAEETHSISFRTTGPVSRAQARMIANALALKRGQGLGRGAGVGNQEVNLVGRADKGRADFAEFARVGDHDDLLGLLEHLAVDQRLVGLQRGGAALGIQSGHAQKHLVHIDVVEEGQRRVAGERERPRPGNHAAGQIGADAGLVAQLHADVDGVGDHLNLVAMAQAAADVRGGGAGGEAHGLVGLDQFGGGQADAAFFLGKALLARQEGAVVAERLVEQRLDQGGAAMGAADQAAVFKPRQVAPDAGRRGAGHGQNLLDGGGSGAEQELDDQFGAAIEWSRPYQHRFYSVGSEKIKVN